MQIMKIVKIVLAYILIFSLGLCTPMFISDIKGENLINNDSGKQTTYEKSNINSFKTDLFDEHSYDFVNKYWYNYYQSTNETKAELYRKIYKKMNSYLIGCEMDDNGCYTCILDYEKYNLTYYDVKELYQVFLNENPEFYFINNVYQNTKDNTFLFSIDSQIFNNDYREKNKNYIDKVISEIDQIIMAKNAKKQIEIVNICYQYLINKLEYSFDEDGNPSSELSTHSLLCLIDGNAVCEGYAKAFEYLLSYYRIPNATASSNDHIWNYVQNEDTGEYYIVDVTSGDTQIFNEYKYFGLSSAEYLGTNEIAYDIFKNINVTEKCMFYSDGIYYKPYNDDLTKLEVDSVYLNYDYVEIPSEHYGMEVTSIDSFCFISSNQIKTLYLPSTIENISYAALWRCNELNKIVYDGNKEMWENINKTTLNGYDEAWILISCADGYIFEQ